MNNIIIRELEKNTYEIKILKAINVYNLDNLEKLTKEIITKIKKKYSLKKEIILNIYPSKYETIIILKDYNKCLYTGNYTEVKINIHTDTIFLYQIDYHDIRKDKYTYSLYYYKHKYYLKIKDISLNEYLKLSEYTKLIYQDTDKILDNALRIKL